MELLVFSTSCNYRRSPKLPVSLNVHLNLDLQEGAVWISLDMPLRLLF